jgi:hypothetical protein
VDLAKSIQPGGFPRLGVEDLQDVPAAPWRKVIAVDEEHLLAGEVGTEPADERMLCVVQRFPEKDLAVGVEQKSVFRRR